MKCPRHTFDLTFALLGLAVCFHACGRTETSQAGDSPRSVPANIPAASPGKPFHRPSGTGPAYWGPGDLYTFLATGEETNGAYFQLEAFVPAGGGPPPHIHRDQDETFYLTEGTLEMRLGDAVVTTKAGDFVNIPRGTLHAFKNVGKDPARMITTFVPAGFEKYFEEVCEVAVDRTAAPPPVTEEFIQKMIAAAPKHGCEILPPEPSGPK